MNANVHRHVLEEFDKSSYHRIATLRICGTSRRATPVCQATYGMSRHVVVQSYALKHDHDLGQNLIFSNCDRYANKCSWSIYKALCTAASNHIMLTLSFYNKLCVITRAHMLRLVFHQMTHQVKWNVVCFSYKVNTVQSTGVNSTI